MINFKFRTKISSKKIILKIIILINLIIWGAIVIHFSFQIVFNTPQPVSVAMSRSMEPNILMGDIIFSRGVNPAQIKVGDIIIFNANGLWTDAPEDPMAHRVVRKWKNDGIWYFQTKGDAYTRNDTTPIPENRILGVVWGRIPFVGIVYVLIKQAGFYFLFIIIFITILICLNLLKNKKKFTWKSYR